MITDRHEQVVFGHDPATGLRAMVAIHSSALGPALGGCRMRPYADEQAMIADALLLSEAMSYKNALAGLHHGGGKAVIWGDPATDKSPELFRAMGRFIATLGGRYITAGDVGTTVADLDVIYETNPWTTGRSPEHGGSGDTGILTAYGMQQAMRAVARHLWGSDSLDGKVIGITGAGKVGRRLAAHLVEEEGARVIITDPSPDAIASVTVDVEVVGSTEELLARELDIYSPNALGHALTPEVARTLTAAAVCGAANNQLATPEVARMLADRGILYAPDYLVNCGGVVQAAEELVPAVGTAEQPRLAGWFDLDRARARVAGVYDTTLRVLGRAEAEGLLPVEAAAREAEDRMAAGGPAFERFKGARQGRLSRPPRPEG
ncbi:MAG: Glu/Leu/Phe/Val family dehydrogenase [Candidatus Nanopelagicales bacterium]